MALNRVLIDVLYAVVEYNDISIKANDTILSEAKSGSDFEANNYNPVLNNDEKLSPDVISTGETSSLVSITAEADGNGAVNGNGSYVGGAKVILTAYDGTIGEFLGWYENDKLISKNRVIMFNAENDREIIGKFITALNKCKVTLKNNEVTYTGKSIKPSVSISNERRYLKENIDYKVEYSNNKNVGTAKVIIEGIGNYSGTIEKTFKISAPMVVSPKIISANLYGYDDLKVNWNSQKVAGVTVKYKMEYKRYDGSWYRIYKGTMATSVKKAYLTDGVRYAFRVTPYVTVDNKNYYGKSKSTGYIYTLKKLDHQ